MSYGDVKECERPLTMPMSKKLSNLNTMFSSPIIPSADCGYLLNTDISVVNHHFSDEKQNKNKRGSSISINMEEVSMGAARWTPTPEQLYALEEIYQSGIRTPSANQIQQIALRLRRFGKIEGKNVFYWFQNHKARDRQKHRQKRRRQQLNHQSLPNEQIKSSGLRRTGFEVGQAKNWVTPSSDCSTVSEESATLSTTEFAKGEIDERIQFEGRRLQPKGSITAEQSMSQMKEFSHLYSAVDQRTQNLVKHLVMPNRDMNTRKYQTLELFPHWNSGTDGHQVIDSPKFSNELEVPTVNTISKFAPTQFLEFL